MAEETKPLRLLSLDGGGIRGLSTLYILKGLMNQLNEKEVKGVARPLLPCDYFDLIVGTSTGGLIAVMLGILRMDIDTCIKEYLEMGPKIFPVEEPLEKAIQRLVQKYLKKDGKKASMRSEAQLQEGLSKCQVVLCATATEPRVHVRFRTYEVPRNALPDCYIWQACRATSAAPTFFPPMAIQGSQYVDGGLGYNNPIRICMDEARQLWGKTRLFGCVVSIGTGKHHTGDIGKGAKIIKTLKEIATDTEKVANELRDEMLSEHGPDQKVYFRFNVSSGLENVGLEECSPKNMGRIKIATQNYLDQVWDRVTTCAAQILSPVGNSAAARHDNSESRIPGPSSQIVTHVGFLSLRPAAAEAVSTLPSHLSQDPDFLGREGILNEIQDRLEASNRVALAGLGGIGKTQIAVHFAHRFRSIHEDCQIFWVYAATAQNFHDSYATIAQKLDLPGQLNPKADIKQLVQAHLESRKCGKWLMILDNADDPSLFYPEHQRPLTDIESEQYLSTYLPECQDCGNIIIVTTRDGKLGRRLIRGREPLWIGPLAPDDAKDVLNAKVTPEKWHDTAAGELLKILYNAPLAITQAAAYINYFNGVSVQEYLDMLKENPSTVAEILNEDLPDHKRQAGVTNAVFKTWKLSYEQICKIDQRAADILSLMAVFDNQSIPQFLILEGNKMSHTERIAIQILRDFSLVNGLGDTYSMHPLVQLSTRDWLSSRNEIKKTQEKALDIMQQKFPLTYRSEQNRILCEKLLSQALYILPDRCADSTGLARLLYRISICEDVSGQYHSSLKHARESYEIRVRILGELDRLTLRAQARIGVVLRRLGKYKEAEIVIRSILERQEKALGADDPDTTSSFNELANVLKSLEKYQEAEEIQRQVVATDERLLPKDDRDVLISLYELGDLLRLQYKYSESENILRRVVKAYETSPQRNEVDLVNAIASLAYVIVAQGKQEEGEGMIRKVLATRKRMQGDDHPDTLITVQKLGNVLGEKGSWDEGEMLLRRVIEGMTRVLGGDHPWTFEAMRDLAYNLKNQGKEEEAEVWQKMADAERL